MKEVEMKIKNEEGKEIVKGVPENLVSNYIAIGWEKVKNDKINRPLSKDNKNDE